MAASTRASWGFAIKRNIYGMFTILVLFIFIGIAVRLWFQANYNQVKLFEHDHHQSFQADYLNHKNQLIDIQKDMLRQTSREAFGGNKLTQSQIEALIFHYFHEVDPLVDSLIELNRTKSKKDFIELEQKLEQQDKVFDDLFNATQVMVSVEHLSNFYHQLETLIDLISQLKQKHYEHYESSEHELALLADKQNKYLILITIILAIISIGVIRNSLLSIQEITLREQEAVETIKNQLLSDNLTALPNRAAVVEYLDVLVADNTNQFAVILIDIDDFKKVNDVLGYEVGDLLLKKFAKRLRYSAQTTDLLGRYEGDQFIVIKSFNDKQQAYFYIQNLLKEIKKPYSIDNGHYLLTASAGIAVYSEDGDSSQKLLQKAYFANQSAKRHAGESFEFYANETDEFEKRRRAIEKNLFSALAKNEFSVVFQPQVDAQSGVVVSAEALIRWNNQELGNVRPDEFIPIAEQNGIIVKLGEFVIQQAFSMLSRWRKFGDFRVSINLSPRQLIQEDFDTLVDVLATEYDLPNQSIDFEITEGVLMGDFNMREMIMKLHQKSFMVSLDDFGTGYSSLSYIKDYPFDAIKIDRSFIRDMDKKHSHQKLVKAAIDMTQSLNMKVVAEGVETANQMTMLKQLNCDYLQGYFHGKPMQADELFALSQTAKKLA
jgi:diguanylate cyclase (GGDEF)-like protein